MVLLAADRYCAVCCPILCTQYRTYFIAVSSSVIAWVLAFAAAIPLYLYSEVVELQTYSTEGLNKPICIAKWPSLTSARWFACLISETDHYTILEIFNQFKIPPYFFTKFDTNSQ